MTTRKNPVFPVVAKLQRARDKRVRQAMLGKEMDTATAEFIRTETKRHRQREAKKEPV